MMHTKPQALQGIIEKFCPVAYGEILWDLFPEKARLGGAPSNVAFHLAQLGAKVSLVSRVGADARGTTALQRLREVGVNCDCVQIDAEHATGFVEVTLEHGEPRYHLNPGGAWQYIELTESVKRQIRNAHMLSFGGLVLRTDHGRRSLTEAVRIASDDCVRLFDMNLRAGHFDIETIAALLEYTDVAKLNDTECALMSKHFATDDLAEYLIRERGVELVALTHGDKGCTLVSKDDRVYHPGFSAAASGDNVGAGDCFVAALGCGVHRGWELPVIAERANRVAAYVASHRGATPSIPKELRSLFAD